MSTQIIDDKSEHCIPFILRALERHVNAAVGAGNEPSTFFIGLNGVQGAGKTTLVDLLSHTLTSPPHNLPVLVLSIDDLYLPHSAQKALATTHPSNPLVQHRGQPSTHDIALGSSLFRALAEQKPNIRIPSYDKSAFGGKGDRRPESEWGVVNREGEAPVRVVVFEGWCVGFRPLSDEEVESKWKAAKREFEAQGEEAYQGRLGRLELESVMFINEKLKAYDELTNQFGAFIHIDAQNPLYVYTWRQQQEAALRAAKGPGNGMSDEQVVEFVDGYYPAYELYTDVLRRGIFPQSDEKGEGEGEGEGEARQLRLVVGEDRRVKEVLEL